MLHWNPSKKYFSRLMNILSRSSQVSKNLAKQPKILTLWLLSASFWVLLICCFMVFMYWYYDKNWLLTHKFYLVLIVLLGIVLSITVPIFWRIFAVIDGQERTISFIQRTEYTRESIIQQNLNSFSNYLKNKYKFLTLNHNFIIAIHGNPEAFSDIGEQLARIGWVQVDHVYLVLINNIDEIENIPNFRGKYHSPFDGLIIINNKNNDQYRREDKNSQWLKKFYDILNWRIPFIHITQSNIGLDKMPINQVIVWKKFSTNTITLLKEKTYELFSLAFLKSKDKKFLYLIDEVEKSSFQMEEIYDQDQLQWCLGIGFQPKKSNWWESWSLVAAQLSVLDTKLIDQPNSFKLAKVNLVLCTISLMLIFLSFINNYNEIKSFQQQIENINSLDISQLLNNDTKKINAILALQNNIATLQNTTKPFYEKLGFNQDRILLEKSLSKYGFVTKKWLIEPADKQIALVLQSLQQFNVILPYSEKLNNGNMKNDSNSTEIALEEGFNALKAYLMLRHKNHLDNIFLAEYLSKLYRTYSMSNTDKAQSIFKFYTRNMNLNPKWFLIQDDVLVAQSRNILNILVNAQQQDIEIYQNLLEKAVQNYNAIDLEQLIGKDVDDFWVNKEKLPSVFTEQAWNEWFKPEIEKLNPDYFKNGSWVLNDNKKNSTEIDIRQKIFNLYKDDYYQAWIRFLSGIRWKKIRGLHNQLKRLKKYSDKQNSVLVKLLKQIQLNTNIGYKQNRANNGKGVLLEFEPIVSLIQVPSIKKSVTTTPLDSYQQNLLNLYLEIQKLQGSINKTTASQMAFNELTDNSNSSTLLKAEKDIDLQVASLGENWQDIGRTLLDYPFTDAKKAILSPALDNINLLWQKIVVTQWNQRFKTKYPVAPSSGQDLSLSELQKFVDLNSGIISQFNKQYLNNVLILVGDQWQINPNVSEQIELNPTFINKLNELNQNLEFLSNGSSVATFEISMLPTPEVKQIRFLADTQKIDYFNEKSFWYKINWPLNIANSKQVAIQWIDIKNHSGQLEIIGDLSILRLLDKAIINSNHDNTYNLKWKINGKQIEMNLKCIQTHDLIKLTKLKNYDFPLYVFVKNKHGN